MTSSTTKRSLYFYELDFSFYKKYEEVEHAYVNCFRHLNRLVRDKNRSRYVKKENYTLFFGQLDFVPDKRFIKGKLFKVRNDVFPQIINMSNEAIQDIVTEEEQGILETTHFLIDYRKKNKAQLTLEYNHYGARISEFAGYLSHLGRKTGIIKKVIVIPVVRDRLESITTRVNKVSNFSIRVHKDNIARIQEQDEGLGIALYHAQNYSQSDYVELDLKIDYKIKNDTPTIREKLLNWVRIFLHTPEESENFEKFRVEAEDEENNNRLEQFDLLIDKEQSQIIVEKKENSRVIVSNDFFPKIISEYERKFQ